MKKNKGGFSLSGAIFALFGLCCALALGGLFYAAMAYQLAGEGEGDSAAADVRSRAAQTTDAGGLLALEGMQPVLERAEDAEMGGTLCRVTTRVYETENGARLEAVTAYPAAYLERMAQEGFVPQLMTGFTIAGLDAVYAVSGGQCALYARDGERVYALFMPADEQAAYALGALSYPEE